MKCKDCACYKNEWCSMVTDSPDPDMERNCGHFIRAQRWIPVAERLPPRKEPVLICFMDGKMEVGFMHDQDEFLTYWCGCVNDGYLEELDSNPTHLKLKWDMIIAHPPCTYLTNAGARWLWAGYKLNQERYQKGLDAKAFFMAFYNADCPKIAVENPVPSTVFEMPPYTQVIQPYEFGHPYSKRPVFGLKACRL